LWEASRHFEGTTCTTQRKKGDREPCRKGAHGIRGGYELARIRRYRWRFTDWRAGKKLRLAMLGADVQDVGRRTMHEQWLADRRDLVKWETLVHVAREPAHGRILQTAYTRLSHRPMLLRDRDRAARLVHRNIAHDGCAGDHRDR
jgi:hypothetical protein